MVRYRDSPTASASITISAPPEVVWSHVTDIGLMAELSEELQAVEWLDGVTEPAPGRRFLGTSRHRAIGEWQTTSTVTACVPAERFAWQVGGEDGQPSATWSFALEAVDGGTRLTQTGTMGPGRSGLSPAIEAMPDKEERIVGNRLREWEAGIDRNLRAIKARAEGAGI
jgi:uncharacterized protein YndB with AHSA1/START domain